MCLLIRKICVGLLNLDGGADVVIDKFVIAEVVLLKQPFVFKSFLCCQGWKFGAYFRQFFFRSLPPLGTGCNFICGLIGCPFFGLDVRFELLFPVKKGNVFLCEFELISVRVVVVYNNLQFFLI